MPTKFILASPGTNPMDEPVLDRQRRRPKVWTMFLILFGLALSLVVGWTVWQVKNAKANVNVELTPTGVHLVSQSTPTLPVTPSAIPSQTVTHPVQPVTPQVVVQVQTQPARVITAIATRIVALYSTRIVPVVVTQVVHVTQLVTTTAQPTYTPDPSQTAAPSYTPYPTFTEAPSQTPWIVVIYETIPPSETPTPTGTATEIPPTITPSPTPDISIQPYPAPQ